MIYDYVILGGGISGLYCAYLLQNKFPEKQILILEKDKNVGGRIHTYYSKYMTVEAGAGRINNKHKRIIRLIRELGLSDKRIHISGDIGYAKVSENGAHHTMLFGKDILSHDYISRVVSSSKREPSNLLKSMSFLDYAKTILSHNEIEYIQDAFGYYSELVLMNAFDALHLMQEIGPNNKFFGLSSGLSQIVFRIREIIEAKGCRIICNKTVENIHHTPAKYNTSFNANANPSDFDFIEVYCNENKRPYIGRNCICALPKYVAEKFSYFKPNRSLFSQIVCAPLCRIYCVFPMDKNGKVWFSGLSKFTTNNNLRMVIPISEKDGTIMISYSDNKYADYWNKLYQSKGEDGLYKELHKLIRNSTGINIPKPVLTKVFYWKCGVGYWGIGADSSHFPLQPNSEVPVYLSGEHYSSTYQQWIEGALETSERVVNVCT